MPAKINPLEHYLPVPESGCWLWLGKITPGGYGSHKDRAAHRISYEAHVGPIPDGHLVCHKCDTRLCINPDHLFTGMYADNHDDMRRKGRQSAGETHGSAKLNKEKVTEIRSHILAGLSQSKIAKLYGITQTMVSRIHTGKAWYGGKFSNIPEANA